MVTHSKSIKYCSTFDSSAWKYRAGYRSIDALLDTDFTIACPAFPENSRTVFKGYLFVGEVLLHRVRDEQASADPDDGLKPRAGSQAR